MGRLQKNKLHVQSVAFNRIGKACGFFSLVGCFFFFGVGLVFLFVFLINLSCRFG